MEKIICTKYKQRLRIIACKVREEKKLFKSFTLNTILK